ncbi:11204_t:CDS:2 [Entrophospora sp. SA101]|nr:11204_t:CDS:2 [Entrophospora sp. SA101]
MCLDFVQKINLKAIDRYENDEDTSDEDNKKNEEKSQNDYEANDIDSGYDYGESNADDETITKRN